MGMRGDYEFAWSVSYRKVSDGIPFSDNIKRKMKKKTAI